MTLQERIKAVPYWYHRIELPDGTVTPGWSPLRAERYSIPADLTGKRVLDIGAWDGYWTWDALKRGAAEVVAIDDFSDDLGRGIVRNGWETFDLCREAFGFRNAGNQTDDGIFVNDKGQSVVRTKMSVYDIGIDNHGFALAKPFDIVFFFGTIYHLKHPLLALEQIASVCKGSIYIESAVCDDYSPYRGGVGRGFANYEMVAEFYPQDQCSANPSNWWCPTLQCLGAMVESVGFKDVSAWALMDAPTCQAECRGFVSGTKDPAVEPACRPEDVELPGPDDRPAARVAGVMSVPRLLFHDNMACAFEAFAGLHIPVMKVQGAFWGQCLERGMMRAIDDGADLIVTIDYDTVFKRRDVEALLDLAYRHPEAAGIVPIQAKRAADQPLLSVKGRSGQPMSEVPLSIFEAETTRIATGHFGLTVLRVTDLMDIPHPWFLGQPNADGMWGPGRVDDDMYFWRKLEAAGKVVLSANRVAVGHLELIATWPDPSGRAIYQQTKDYHERGKPKAAWK
ncbi:MAG: hypothetical protein QM570_15490 [Planctomycetota bacterium]|jgi:tRNA (mo5U34)-methyltransferase|nr:hypothetical protein [Planctomycetota bacterium]